jgi:hypothetical protein
MDLTQAGLIFCRLFGDLDCLAFKAECFFFRRPSGILSAVAKIGGSAARPARTAERDLPSEWSSGNVEWKVLFGGLVLSGGVAWAVYLTTAVTVTRAEGRRCVPSV